MTNIPYSHKLYENTLVDDKYARHYLTQLKPYVRPYYCDIPASWSFLYSDLSELRQTEEIIFRDGIITLLAFFKKFPDPINITTQFYIHHSLAQFVPSSWSKNFGTFNLKSKKIQSSNKFIVPFAPGEKFSEKVVQELAPLIETDSVITLITPNNSNGQVANELYDCIDLNFRTIKFFEVLHKAFPTTAISIFTDTDINSIENIQNYNIYDTSSYSPEFGDNTITHQLLSLGATISNSCIDSQDRKLVSLSLNHDIQLTAGPLPSSKFWSDFTIESALENQAIWEHKLDSIGNTHLFNDELFHLANYALLNYAN